MGGSKGGLAGTLERFAKSTSKSAYDSAVLPGSAILDVASGKEDLGGVIRNAIQQQIMDPAQQTTDLVTDLMAQDQITLPWQPHGRTPDDYEPPDNPFATTDDDDSTTDDDEELPTYLGRLATQKRTERGGRGIGANILTGGTGIKKKAPTKRKTLLSA